MQTRPTLAEYLKQRESTKGGYPRIPYSLGATFKAPGAVTFGDEREIAREREAQKAETLWDLIVRAENCPVEICYECDGYGQCDHCGAECKECDGKGYKDTSSYYDLNRDARYVIDAAPGEWIVFMIRCRDVFERVTTLLTTPWLGVAILLLLLLVPASWASTMAQVVEWDNLTAAGYRSAPGDDWTWIPSSGPTTWGALYQVQLLPVAGVQSASLGIRLASGLVQRFTAWDCDPLIEPVIIDFPVWHAPDPITPSPQPDPPIPPVVPDVPPVLPPITDPPTDPEPIPEPGTWFMVLGAWAIARRTRR